jgi:D-alanyl-D-alanine carboxypeptidase (penicillin-binding protein 5/6)
VFFGTIAAELTFLLNQGIFLLMLFSRSIIRFATALVCGVVLSSPVYSSQIIIPSPPDLAAKSYFLIDANTGKVLVENNPDLKLAPASLTKMMTSYIVSGEIHEGRLQESDLVFVSDNAWRRGGSASGSSTMFLEARSKITVKDLMRGVIVQSGNDASIALAEHLAGTETGFADIMNQQAQLLGMSNTTFKNATGWPAEGHVSTARDLAILAKAVINDHPKHYGIYSEESFTHNGHTQYNRNKLLFRDKSVDGLKTGHTKEAGYCLVSSSENDGMRLIAVVMGTRSKEARAAESLRLLKYGFRYFATHKLYDANTPLEDLQKRVWYGEQEQIEFIVGDDIFATIPRGSHDKLEANSNVDTIIKAPITKGQELGELVLTLDGEEVLRAPLLAANAIEEAGMFSRLWDSMVLMVGGE